MEAINLRELYGKRYKIGLDEAAQSEPNGKNDPWYFQVLCIHGDVYPYSDKLLAFFCKSAEIRNRLHKDHPQIEVRNWSDNGEAIFLFKPEQFELVAEYAKPRKKRVLSKKERKRLLKVGQAFQFKKLDGAEDTTGTEESPNGKQGV